MKNSFTASVELKSNPETTTPELDPRAQDVFVIVLGTVIFISPWFNGNAIHPHGSLITQSLGACICAVAIWGIGRPGQILARYLEGLLGLSLVAAPFYTRGVALHFAECVIVGLLVCGLFVSTFVKSPRPGGKET